MMHEHIIQKYRYWYSKLLQLYSKSYYERFGEGMKQTFSDILRAQAKDGKDLFSCALWMFIETSGGIIKNNLKFMFMNNKRILIVIVITVLILMIPFVAMQFTNEVDWSPGDFLIMGVLILGLGLAFEFSTRKGSLLNKFAIAIAVGTAFLLTWSNLAVGFIGDANPANLLFFVLVIFLGLGTIISGLDPRKMSRLLFTVAIIQIVIPVIALIFWNNDFAPGVLQVFILTAFFAGLWTASGLLFMRASTQKLEIKPAG
ncbi:MAG TPA: hypothetical protein VHP32_05895 [Ignavibacteria bacterium]|nr:hypothetical protein [Ignavibacteria bacterium]